MSKYSKLNDLVAKGKSMSIGMTISDQYRKKDLQQFSRERNFREHKDEEMINFGMELFDNGYTLEDFQAQVEEWKLYLDIPLEELALKKDYLNGLTKSNFPKIEKILSYDKILKIVKDDGFFNTVKIGYEIAARKNLAASIEGKRKK